MRLSDNPMAKLRPSRFFLYPLLLALLMVTAAAAGVVSAQSSGNGKYDTDGDGLIEISNLEQLDAVSYDRNGNGIPDEGYGFEPAHPNSPEAIAYAAAFPTGPDEEVCGEGCTGYELARSLDFFDPASYASGTVNPDWTEGEVGGPYGFYIDEFRATFDGNGNTISNLRDGVLFQTLYNPAVITRIGLLDVEAAGCPLVVWNRGGEIRHSYSTGSAGGGGGLVCENAPEGLIADSYSTVTITVTHSDARFVGGLVGWNQGQGIITRSYATGNVWAPSALYVGGLTGAGSTSHSYATGNVTGGQYVGGLAGGWSIASHSYATGNVNGGEMVGGLVGQGSASHSYATGNVTGNALWTGGLVGEATGDIIASYATGHVTGPGRHPLKIRSVGGLVGSTHHAVIASYATGHVSNGSSVGGLVGSLTRDFGDNAEVGDVKASYSLARITGVGQKGALVGGAKKEARISDSYWNMDIFTTGTGNPDGPVARGLTTAQLQSPTGYTGVYANWNVDLDNADGDDNPATGADDFWDFGTDSQYPVLKADMDGDGIATAAEFGVQNPRRGAATACAHARSGRADPQRQVRHRRRPAD